MAWENVSNAIFNTKIEEGMGCITPERNNKISNDFNETLFNPDDVVGELVLRIDCLGLNLSRNLAEKRQKLVFRVWLSNQLQETMLERNNYLTEEQKQFRFVLNRRHLHQRFFVFELWNIFQGGKTDVSCGIHQVDMDSLKSSESVESMCCLNYETGPGGKLLFSYHLEPTTYEILQLGVPSLIIRTPVEELKDLIARVVIGEEQYSNQIKEITENKRIKWNTQKMIFNVPDHIQFASFQILKIVGKNQNLKGETKIDLNKCLTVNSHAEIIEDISLEGKLIGEVRLPSFCSEGKVGESRRRLNSSNISLKCIDQEGTAKCDGEKAVKIEPASPPTETVIVNSREIGIQLSSPIKDEDSPTQKTTTLPPVSVSKFTTGDKNEESDVYPFKVRTDHNIISGRGFSKDKRKVSSPPESVMKAMGGFIAKRKRSLCNQVI